MDELDFKQELFGLGVSNVLGSFFSPYPTTRSFSRSTVNHKSGAKPGVADLVSGIITNWELLFLTPLFEHLHQCVLAAFVLSAVMSQGDEEFLWTFTSTMTLFLGSEIGVLAVAGSTLSYVIHESINPLTVVLGCLPGTTVYRNVKQYHGTYTYHGLLIVHIDVLIYLENTSYIKDRLRKYGEDSCFVLARGYSDIPIFTNVEVVLEFLEVRTLCACGGQTIADGNLIDLLRLVSTFALLRWHLALSSCFQQWDPGGRDLIFHDYCTGRVFGRRFCWKGTVEEVAAWRNEFYVRSQCLELRLEDKSVSQEVGNVRTPTMGPYFQAQFVGVYVRKIEDGREKMLMWHGLRKGCHLGQGIRLYMCWVEREWISWENYEFVVDSRLHASIGAWLCGNVNSIPL